MPRATSKEALLEQRRKIDERLKRLEARGKVQARKADTRCKIIAGALALEHMQKDEAFGRELHALLDRFVEREQDRALFGLPPKRSQGEADSLAGEFRPPATGTEPGPVR